MNDSSSPIRVSREESNALLHITLARPKGNILDREMVSAIRAAVAEHSAAPELKAILFDGDGKHFSFGASVAEHTPEQVGKMLPEFHAMFRELAASERVLLAAVRGQCLGGGLELVMFCHRIAAGPHSGMGNPEIKLGVFAPLASALLPHRVGQRHADDLLLTGRSVDENEALHMGLIDAIEDEPTEALRLWFQKHLAPLSGAALRHAVRASRHNFHNEVLASLDAVEKIYLNELMSSSDAPEGIAAFLEKRAPVWSHQ